KNSRTACGITAYFSCALPPPFLISVDPINPKDILWVKLKLSRSVSLLRGVVYRPPQSSPLESQLLSDQFKPISGTHPFTHLLITGEFNATGLDWLRAYFGRPFIDLVLENSWTQHVDQPTKFRPGQAPSLLDLIITNEKNQINMVNLLTRLQTAHAKNPSSTSISVDSAAHLTPLSPSSYQMGQK
ncbi:unnamed protein product, partial [Echinostoma caproni]|uniref:Endo/exonuclease/phosphatase domain-containing protein n=1 Tax=Echinostoma caproni TaxID=27848 RepID=A0A183AXU2_9TREM